MPSWLFEKYWLEKGRTCARARTSQHAGPAFRWHAGDTEGAESLVAGLPHDDHAERQPLGLRVLGLAAPVIGENLLQTLLGVVDTILVAGLARRRWPG